jgi:hypothetical protein
MMEKRNKTQRKRCLLRAFDIFRNVFNINDTLLQCAYAGYDAHKSGGRAPKEEIVRTKNDAHSHLKREGACCFRSRFCNELLIKIHII